MLYEGQDFWTNICAFVNLLTIVHDQRRRSSTWKSKEMKRLYPRSMVLSCRSGTIYKLSLFSAVWRTGSPPVIRTVKMKTQPSRRMTWGDRRDGLGTSSMKGESRFDGVAWMRQLWHYWFQIQIAVPSSSLVQHERLALWQGYPLTLSAFFPLLPHCALNSPSPPFLILHRLTPGQSKAFASSSTLSCIMLAGRNSYTRKWVDSRFGLLFLEWPPTP